MKRQRGKGEKYFRGNLEYKSPRERERRVMPGEARW